MTSTTVQNTISHIFDISALPSTTIKPIGQSVKNIQNHPIPPWVSE